jgi:predicted DNA-binding protein YlxM (UPF0122 family)
MKSYKELTKDSLFDLYVNQDLSARDISKIYDCSHGTITARLRIFNIPIKGNFYIDKKELENLYLNQKLSTRTIAKMFNTDRDRIRTWLNRHNIPIRHDSEAVKTQWIDNTKRRNAISKIFSAVDRKGEKHPNWKGGESINDAGYKMIFNPNHPRAHQGKVREHIVVMENKLGRPLKFISPNHPDNEVVHHKNKIKTDNRIENLELMTFYEHVQLHAKLKRHLN